MKKDMRECPFLMLWRIHLFSLVCVLCPPVAVRAVNTRKRGTAMARLVLKVVGKTWNTDVMVAAHAIAWEPLCRLLYFIWKFPTFSKPQDAHNASLKFQHVRTKFIVHDKGKKSFEKWCQGGNKNIRERGKMNAWASKCLVLSLIFIALFDK